jgi:nascent polypeptide-associated complex subunit alpha
VIANSYEEKELETPIFSEDDIMLVCSQANVTPEVAANALKETGGDLSRAILLLTTK